MLSITIEAAQSNDLPAILALLERSGLPQDGVSDYVATTLVAREEQTIVGSAALEVYGTAALLRSVAVEQRLRGQGLGQRLTMATLDLAKKKEISIVYLLTETASGFFPRFGFRPIPRSEVQSAIHRSPEWTTACPASAQVMVTQLH
jgi:amino-acid N-acetyltransferase